MKLYKRYFATFLGLSLAVNSYAQHDLIQQVPEHASFVAVFNNQAIIKHSSFEKINEVLGKLGAFDAWGSHGMKAENINDLDLSYDRNAYIYKIDTDSSYYFGLLLPLKEGHQVSANSLKNITSLPASGGYERGVSTDGKTHVAWDKHSLTILTGDARKYYFDNDTVAQRYGIEIPSYDDYDSPAAYDYAPVDTVYAESVAADYQLADTVATEWEAYDFEDSITSSIDSATTEWEAYDVNIDSLYNPDATDALEYHHLPPAKMDVDTGYSDYFAFDNYTDSTYEKAMARNAKNDSLRNVAFASWIARDFDSYLKPARNASSIRYVNKFDKKNALVHIWSRNLMSIYSHSLPYYMPSMQYAISNQMEKIAYSYQDIVLDLVQDKHALKLQGSFGLDKEMEQIISPVYKNKMNRKFARYIPENHIGYMSLNVNAEAYLRNIPLMMEHMYGSMSYLSLGDYADIFVTALEITLDEKAIARVMGGDHLLFVKELKKVEKEYIDYQYDDETFEYTEVKKKKDDYIPTFLWMFTSEDQRIYQKLLKLGMSKDKVTQTGAIYSIHDNPSDELIYVLFKDNIVFVSNDEDELRLIEKNRFRTSRDSKIKKDIFANTMTAVTHLSEIPETVNRLGIPVIKSWDRLVNNLSNYGDVSISVQGNKKGRITGELSLDFPKSQTNALQYLLQEILTTIDK